MAAPCSVIRGSGMTCHWIRPNVQHWNSTSGFDFDHIIAVDMSFCTNLRNFIKIGPPLAEKNDAMSIFKMAELSHLGFQGSNNGFFEKPYRSSTDTIDCLVFESVFCILATDRQTDRPVDEQMDSIDALSRSRCRERQLKNSRFLTNILLYLGNDSLQDRSS